MQETPPMVTYTGHYRGNADSPPKLNWHSHRCPELVLAIGGLNRTLFPRGVVFECPPGSLLVTPPETLHKQVDQGFSELYYVGFDPGSPELDLSLRQVLLKNDDYFQIWMKQILELFTHEGEIAQANRLLGLLLLRLRTLEKERDLVEQRHPALRRAVRFLKEHFTEPLTQEEIARRSGLSPSRLNVLFRQEFGVSIMRMVTRKRMFLARMLLTDPLKSVTEVAELTGYSDMNYFVRAFRREHGVTPLEFRKNASRSLRDFTWQGETS